MAVKSSKNDGNYVNLIERNLTVSGLSVSIPIQNFATIPLGFPESSILMKRKQELLVEIKYAKMNLCALKVILDQRNKFISGFFRFTEF